MADFSITKAPVSSTFGFKAALSLGLVIAGLAGLSACAQVPVGRIQVKNGPVKVDSKKAQLEGNFFFNQAEELRQKGKLDEAIPKYEKAIRAYPHDGSFYKNLGAAYATKGRLTEAERTLRQGIEVKPNDWLLWNNLAVVLQGVGKKDECARAIKKALALNPPASEAEKMNVTLAQLSQASGGQKKN